MTTNIDRATDVIARCWPNGRGVRKDDAAILAQALADATPTLLMPDLPKPDINADDDNPEWHADEYTVDVDRGMVSLWTPDGTHWEQTPNRARTLVFVLLAATDYAEACRVEQLGSEIADWSTELNRRLEGGTQ